MPSEQRLHPASLLFMLWRSVKAFALPGLVLLVSAGRRSQEDGAAWQLWIMLLLIPAAVIAVARYLSFRLRYEGSELVIRSGMLFRNERHVPYARIQNLDAVQNVFHRALGVVEVRVETGAGKEPEATISVLPAHAFNEMRRRVFEGRAQGGAPVDATGTAPDTAVGTPEAQTLLHLPLGELLLCGLLENRGLVLIAAAYGVLWELGLLDRLGSLVFDDASYGRGFARELVSSIAAGRGIPVRLAATALFGVMGLIIFVAVVSMVWAVIRLYDFRLTRAGDDLRTRFGLLTRVTSTVPLRRIQTITIREGPLHRRLGRASLRVETAGGGQAGGGAGKSEREWLAPIIRVSELPDLLRHIQPDFELAGLPWQPVHPRAFRRAVKPAMLRSSVLPLALAWPVGWWAIGLWIVLLPLAIVSARRRVANLGWVATDEVVVFRSGWIWRSVTIARVAKIQAVTRVETPFDRRTGMAQVRVDTAGASERSHRVRVPYLPRDTASLLHHQLAVQAAQTAFRW